MLGNSENLAVKRALDRVRSQVLPPEPGGGWLAEIKRVAYLHFRDVLIKVEQEFQQEFEDTAREEEEYFGKGQSH